MDRCAHPRTARDLIIDVSETQETAAAQQDLRSDQRQRDSRAKLDLDDVAGDGAAGRRALIDTGAAVEAISTGRGPLWRRLDADHQPIAGRCLARGHRRSDLRRCDLDGLARNVHHLALDGPSMRDPRRPSRIPEHEDRPSVADTVTKSATGAKK